MVWITILSFVAVLIALIPVVLMMRLLQANSRVSRTEYYRMRLSSTIGATHRREDHPARVTTLESLARDADVEPGYASGGSGAPGGQYFSERVFSYSIRSRTERERSHVPDLGGFAEVILRLHDDTGRSFPVHRRLSLN